MINNIINRFFPQRESPVILPACGQQRGTAVISYISWPLRKGWEIPKARGHTNAFEVAAMTESWRNLGFRVEIISHDNSEYRPPNDCRIAIDIHRNMERWDCDLPDSCLKILHATGPHWLMWNQAELARLVAVRDRTGIALMPRRQVLPSRGVEVADHVVVLGNDFTLETFLFGGKPVTRVPISSAYELPWPEERNFDYARRRFLWVGSYGMIHKGLDLALEAFSEMPELELTVCGRPEKEPDFFRLYEKHLRGTANIRFHGWLDMGTPDFLEIARTHASVIYPSSAEGGAGSVIHCMHAGMLPICTTEASIDLKDFGVHVSEGSVQAVQASCRELAGMPSRDVEVRARQAWEHARATHTRKCFQSNYAVFAARIAQELD
jgi:glycosyltransferase involved in cell wall biosynthesis